MAKAKAEKAEKANPAVETPERMTTVRATFSGFMTAFGLMTVPVKSYKATDKDGIERHTYHSADCLSRIKQNTNVVCSGCGAEVDKAATVKGVEVDGSSPPPRRPSTCSSTCRPTASTPSTTSRASTWPAPPTAS